MYCKLSELYADGEDFQIMRLIIIGFIALFSCFIVQDGFKNKCFVLIDIRSIFPNDIHYEQNIVVLLTCLLLKDYS